MVIWIFQKEHFAEVFLPSWEAGIKENGALGVMATYPSVDGIPAHSSSEILTGILREELNFKGLVLSEGNGVNTLIYNGLVETEKEAVVMVAKAGMDVSISFDQGYFGEMIENVNEGKVSMETIDHWSDGCWSKNSGWVCLKIRLLMLKKQ